MLSTRTPLYAEITKALENDAAIYSSYSSADVYAHSLFSRELLRKRDDSGDFDKLCTLAVSSFKQTELEVSAVNKILQQNILEGLCPSVSRILYAAQRKIGLLLHDVTWPMLLSDCRHGPGVTRSVTYKQLGIDTKYDESSISVTKDALKLAQILMGGVAVPRARGIPCEGPVSLLRKEFITFPGDKITFVPKSVSSVRSIAVGCTANVYIQLGIGEFLRRRLKRWGIDIKDQTLNQDLARLGSATGICATIDLRNASNTLSRELVRTLLPPHIYSLLDLVRSKVYTLDGKSYISYEMFSGMGNGFTFPLQTMIYHALVDACIDECGENHEFHATYGDDIVIPTRCYDLVFHVLSTLGFSINLDKTFTSGPFRESCGGQFYLGKDIRPVYHRRFSEKVSPQQACALYHKISLWQLRMLHAGLSVRAQSVLALLRPYCYRHGKPPQVPMNAPIGSGFPMNYTHLDRWVGNWFVSRRRERPSREPARLAHSLDGSVPSLISSPFITSKDEGVFEVKRCRGLMLGFYSE